MKNIKIYSLVSLLLILFSCEKDLPIYFEFQGYEFASTDPNGGSWTPILISEGSDISIPAPEEVTSDTYVQELEDLKFAMAHSAEEDDKAVAYWTQNPIIRWNEIALELIAKYNIIPGPNPDGTYPSPDPASPIGPPAFPFAHPPYAVRALAYLSVAQFDGLISAWHYKYQYNRAAPFIQDESIRPIYRDNITPSYPSDGAVIARASREILTAMFPLEANYLAEQEAEHLRCLILSGVNVQSDVDAGVMIGDAIAEVALTRAANDGMKNAQAPKSVSDSLAAAALNRFGWQWINQEIPQRPVGLTPLYGKVKMWSIENVEDTRPIAPPAIGSSEYEADVRTLKEYEKNVTNETRRIANFWQDGLGTYTPPGHWNEIAIRYITRDRMNPLRSARTFAYLNIAMMDGGISCWDAKYYYHYPRPIQTIEGFTTIAGTPNFPAYTSGHSVFSAAGAEVLSYIFPADASTFRGWAEEAAISRVYGGIHWTFDATVGTAQGIDVASYTIAIAQNDGAD